MWHFRTCVWRKLALSYFLFLVYFCNAENFLRAYDTPARIAGNFLGLWREASENILRVYDTPARNFLKEISDNQNYPPTHIVLHFWKFFRKHFLRKCGVGQSFQKWVWAPSISWKVALRCVLKKLREGKLPFIPEISYPELSLLRATWSIAAILRIFWNQLPSLPT